MKKIILAIILLFTINAHAQLEIVKTEKPIEIGKISNLGQLSIKCEKYGSEYIFTYQDIKFQQLLEYKSFALQNEQAFEDLYKLIEENWDNPPTEDIMIKLDHGYLWVRFVKAIGVTNVAFSHSVDENAEIIGFSGWLTKRRVDKLFGKK